MLKIKQLSCLEELDNTVFKIYKERYMNFTVVWWPFDKCVLR